MRQLKGKIAKESKKDKRERRQENIEIHKNLFRIVIPTLVAIVVGIVTFVYVNSRPSMKIAQ